MKRKVTVLMLTAIAFTLYAFMPKAVDQQPWPVPDKYKKMSNPSKGDAAAVTAGKALWGQHCKSCHVHRGRTHVARRRDGRIARTAAIKPRSRGEERLDRAAGVGDRR